MVMLRSVYRRGASSSLISSWGVRSARSMSSRNRDIAIIGGGAAGMVAALEASNESIGRIFVLESQSKPGGNSAKASSGMNGCYTAIQRAQGVQDSLELFQEDTLRMAKGMANPELIAKLVKDSESAISLIRDLGLPFKNTVQLGGHSAARTHRLEGMPIGAALMKCLANEVSKKENIKVETGVSVNRLLWNEKDGRKIVHGVVYSSAEGNETSLEAGAVILASGGYARGNDLMREFAPSCEGKATSSGPQATGLGIKLAREIGVELVNMDRVQIHPTGFIDPSNPSVESKILAPEALRGSGGILVNQDGMRFANELGSRSYLSEHIEHHCKPFKQDLASGERQTVAFMFLNSQGAEQFGSGPMAFYRSKNLFKEYPDMLAACEATGLPIENMKRTIEEYSAAAEKGSDEFEKHSFPSKFDLSEKVLVALVTPVIHYSLGGIKIDTLSRVLAKDSDGETKPVEGLYAAGECTGGVHGFDRLGGNSLLECVVFGRTAGAEASKSVTVNQ